MYCKRISIKGFSNYKTNDKNTLLEKITNKM